MALSHEVLIGRFRAKFAVSERGCWEWTACLHTEGYGDFWDGSQMRGAHRIAYELFIGPIPPGCWVLHTCDNRRCVNPDHLYAGTHADNMRDCVARQRSTLGVRNPNARLTEEQVRAIRNAPSCAAAADLATKFGCSKSHGYRIREGEAWRHVLREGTP